MIGDDLIHSFVDHGSIVLGLDFASNRPALTTIDPPARIASILSSISQLSHCTRRSLDSAPECVLGTTIKRDDPA